MPVLVGDVIPMIYSTLVDDPISLLRLLKCAHSMLQTLKPILTSMMENFHSLITSRLVNGNWEGVDFESIPLFFQSFRLYLDNSYPYNYTTLQTLSSRPVDCCRDSTMLILSLLKRAILEDTYIFIKNAKGVKVSRFLEPLHPDTRLRNVYWLSKYGEECKPILETKIRVAPNLDTVANSLLVTEALAKITCPTQRELLECYYKHTKPKTVWEKMKFTFTLTSNIQKIRKPQKEDCLSRVVIPLPSHAGFVHIEHTLSKYFVYVGPIEGAQRAVKLNYEKSSVFLLIMEKALALSRKPPVIDLTL